MPRTVEEILAQADEFASRFKTYESAPGGKKDAAALRSVREAFEDLALAQKRLAERVAVAKASGHSRASIGAMLGTSGEAARQRYGAAPAQGTAGRPRPKRYRQGCSRQEGSRHQGPGEEDSRGKGGPGEEQGHRRSPIQPLQGPPTAGCMRPERQPGSGPILAPGTEPPSIPVARPTRRRPV
jgi:hypothetical protein